MQFLQGLLLQYKDTFIVTILGKKGKPSKSPKYIPPFFLETRVLFKRLTLDKFKQNANKYVNNQMGKDTEEQNQGNIKMLLEVYTPEVKVSK